MTSPLRALRAASGHSASWCAEHIGHVSKRTWSYWENGRNGSFPRVPDDVMEKMLALASAVQNALNQTKGKKMNGFTRRNAGQGIIMNSCGLLQERVFWMEKNDDGQYVVREGTLLELDRAYNCRRTVPSPLGVDFKYHIDADNPCRVMYWDGAYKERILDEYETPKEALARLESLWKQEIWERDNCPIIHYTREDAQKELDEFLAEE